MKLAELLTEDLIRIPLQSTEKTQIIEELVDILYSAKKIEDRDRVLKAVLEREKVMSTGVGNSVAIPHGKSDSVKTLSASFGVTRGPVDFEATDDRPVRLVFLLIGSQDQTGPHLKALSRIARLMSEEKFRDQLIIAKSASEVLSAIREEEEKLFEA